MSQESGLKVIDAHDLEPELRAVLRPGEMVRDSNGRRHRLPRYFYEVGSYEEATAIQLAPHFRLNEFIRVDIKEESAVQSYPRYIPCAVRLLAFYLEQIRGAFGQSMHISVNGGYRSPAHRLACQATPHCWGTAADVYRIGNTIINEQDRIEKYNRIAEQVAEQVFTSAYGHEPGLADDHIHLDIGYITLVPREISEDRMELPQEKPRFAFEERRAGDRRITDSSVGSPSPTDA
ncbi:MAG: D-Ala-D-Ala carboxypeptidase family metallohydrolase [Acidobacteriota bacterium]